MAIYKLFPVIKIHAIIREEEWDEKKFGYLVHYLVHVDGVTTID
jgi:hypothetical protein